MSRASGNGGHPANGASATVTRRMGRLRRLAVMLVPGLMGLFTLRKVASPDIGFHLRAGNYILDGNGWPATDPFTFTVGDHAYIDTSWGYQVVVSLIEHGLGAPGMVLFHVVLVLALFTLLIRTALILPGNRQLLALLLLIGGLAAEPRFEVRPELWSYVLLALVLYLLHRRAEGLASPLWLLPPIFLVWANSHSLFVLGGGVVACFVVGLWWRRKRLDRVLLAWAAGSLAAVFVNPYGWKAVIFPLTLFTRMQERNIFSANIGEFISPLRYAVSDQLAFYLVPLACFFSFALLVVLSVRRLFRQKRYWCVLLAVMFLPLAFLMFRNIPILIVTCLPATVWGTPVDSVLRGLRTSGNARRRMGRAVAGLLIVVTVVLGLRVMTDAYYIDSRRLERFGLGWNSLALPVDAVAHVERAGVAGRGLNHLNFGGYLMWARRKPVFIDGRLEVMGEAFYGEYRRALESREGLLAAAARYGIEWVIFPFRLRPDLLGGLTHDPRWRLIYVDHLAAVFVRAKPGWEARMHESAHRVAQLAPEVVDVTALPGLYGNARMAQSNWRISRVLRRRTYPAEAFNRGIFHFHRRDPLRAAQAFSDAVEQSAGAYYEIYDNLGAALFALGRYEDARECYRLVQDELPVYRRARWRLVSERLGEIDRRLRSRP